MENMQKTQVSNNSPSKTDHMTKSDQSASKNQIESHDCVDKTAGSSSESHATKTNQSSSSIYHQSPNTGATADTEPWKPDVEDPCSLSSSLPETALRLSSEDTSHCSAEREDTLRRSSEPVAVQKDTHVLSSPQPPIRSPPITIQVLGCLTPLPLPSFRISQNQTTKYESFVSTWLASFPGPTSTQLGLVLPSFLWFQYCSTVASFPSSSVPEL